MKKLELHPLCAIFPKIDDKDVAELAEDIKLHGQRQPIVLFEGKILDGQNRYAACLLAGVEPKSVEFDGENPLSFVISTNLRRRHLSESQRAFIADQLATLRQGEPKSNRQHCRSSQDEAASVMNVSTRSVRKARKVREKGSRKLGEMVRDGQVTVNAAAAIANLPKEEQAKVTRQGPQAVRNAAKEVTIQNLSNSGAYDRAPKEPAQPPAFKPQTPATLSEPLQPITDPESAAAFIQALYERDKPWFNDLIKGQPRRPADIIDHIIAALNSP